MFPPLAAPHAHHWRHLLRGTSLAAIMHLAQWSRWPRWDGLPPARALTTPALACLSKPEGIPGEAGSRGRTRSTGTAPYERSPLAVPVRTFLTSRRNHLAKRQKQ